MITKNEFFNKYASDITRKEIFAGIGVCFLIAATSIISIILYGIVSAIDLAIFVFFGVCMLMLKSRLCAILATAYYSIGKIILAIDGYISILSLVFTIFIITLLIIGIIGTFNLEKEYTQFLSSKNKKYIKPKLDKKKLVINIFVWILLVGMVFTSVVAYLI